MGFHNAWMLFSLTLGVAGCVSGGLREYRRSRGHSVASTGHLGLTRIERIALRVWVVTLVIDLVVIGL